MNQVVEMEQATHTSQTQAPRTVRLQDHVQAHLDQYFSQLGGAAPSNVYNMVLQQVEKPMLEVVLQHMRYNQSKTAVVLGISRGTLRKKMKEYGLLKSED